MEEHFVGRLSLRGLIELENRVFMCRGIGDKVWQLPGGRMQANEEPTDALIRELKEELGVDGQVIKPLWAGTSFHVKSNTKQLIFVYLVSIGGQEMIIDSTETEETRWCSRDELKILPMFEDCRRFFDEFLK